MYGQLSEKADVYSFGVLILEIVSGVRNTDPTQAEDDIYLPSRVSLPVSCSLECQNPYAGVTGVLTVKWAEFRLMHSCRAGLRTPQKRQVEGVNRSTASGEH